MDGLCCTLKEKMRCPLAYCHSAPARCLLWSLELTLRDNGRGVSTRPASPGAEGVRGELRSPPASKPVRLLPPPKACFRD
jgi:hypothetical protein